MTAWGWGGGNDKTFTMPSAVNNGAWHHVVRPTTGPARPLHRRRRAARADRDPGHRDGRLRLRHRSGHRPRRQSTRAASSTAPIDEVSLYTIGADPGDGHRPLPARRRAAVDATGPTGGSVDATGLVGTGSRYATSTTLSLALAKGTDPSGVATTGNLRPRASASLTDGSCGTFGGYSLVTGGDRPDLADRRHGRRRGLLPLPVRRERHARQRDHLHEPRHQGRHQRSLRAVLAFSAFTNAWWPGPARRSTTGPPPTSGSVRVTATATDAASGIASYAFPALGTELDLDPGRPRREHLLLDAAPRPPPAPRPSPRPTTPAWPRRTRRSRSPRTTPRPRAARSPTPTPRRRARPSASPSPPAPTAARASAPGSCSARRPR